MTVALVIARGEYCNHRTNAFEEASGKIRAAMVAGLGNVNLEWYLISDPGLWPEQW
jgi:hypothetical protein